MVIKLTFLTYLHTIYNHGQKLMAKRQNLRESSISYVYESVKFRSQSRETAASQGD